MNPETGKIEELASKLKRDTVLDLVVESLDDRAQGVGAVLAKRGDGLVEIAVTIPRCIVGDSVRVSTTAIRKGKAGCRVLELLAPSEQRIAPRCPHFGLPVQDGPACGGCALQSMSYEDQLAAKVAQVDALLERAGHDASVRLPAIGCAEPWFYRNKMEFSFGRNAANELTLGLYPRGYKYEVLGLDSCLLQSPESARLVVEMARWANTRALQPVGRIGTRGFLRTLTIREGKRTGERMVELTTTGDASTALNGNETSAEAVVADFLTELQAASVRVNAPISAIYWTQHHAAKGQPTTFEHHHLGGQLVLHEELHLPAGPLRFQIHPRAFFQPNTLQAEVLYTEVIKAVSPDGIPAGHVLDLYCGTGTIGLAMAASADRVTGIELQPDAVENARTAAKENGLDNATFFAGDVALVLKEQMLASTVDHLVVDPPRSGLTPAAVEQIRAIGAPRIVYVSCNPKSLARDAALFAHYDWKLLSVQPVDMFPHTAHIENIAVLERS
ncbi:MAG: 23S rRNA (uracil1939-C5)-methyltransferase [Myxococcota bacterium]|jgi:23S rRNA (uracil1939-C5)-methyltransferase